MTKMILTEDILAKMDKSRLFELLIFEGLPISQAVAVHLCDDLKWRQCDAARMVGLTDMAIADARRKGNAKLNKKVKG